MTKSKVVVYDQKYLEELRARNEVRLEAAKKQLGTKWLLHPDHKVTKQKGN